MSPRKRILSGIQPSGTIHIGNYFGAIENWVRLMDEYDCFFTIVDLHAITVTYDPALLQRRIWDAALDNMAAGLDPAKVREICAAVAAETGEVVSPANYNEPAQTVIAGSAGAVERAGVKLKEAGARRVLPLPVSAPFHCALMQPVKARLEPVIRGIAWRAPLRPVVTNVEAKANADAARIVPLLLEQVTSPVRWIEGVQELVRLGVTRMVEVGPGKVLSGLAKRIDKSVEVWNVEDRASLEKTVAALRG